MEPAYHVPTETKLMHAHSRGGGGGGGGGGGAEVRRGCGRGYTAIGCEAEPQKLRVVVYKI